MGFIVNVKKSVTKPAQTIEFLGFTVDSVSMELRLPLDKMKKIRAEARKLEKEGTVSARALARLLGKNEFYFSSHSPSSSFLQEHTEVPLSSTGSQLTRHFPWML